jgi:hypothetical protein
MDMQDILGGFIFLGIFAVLAVCLLGDMNQQIERIEKELNKEDKYIN